MSKDKETWLKDYKKQEDHIPLPQDIDSRIQEGIQQAKKLKAKREKRVQIIRVSTATVMVAAILLFAGLTALTNQEQLPYWLNKNLQNLGLVDEEKEEERNEKKDDGKDEQEDTPNKDNMIEYLGVAKVIDQTVKHGDISFTVKNIVADQKKVIFDYMVKVEGPKVDGVTAINREILGENGQSPLREVHDYRWNMGFMEQNIRSGTMEFDIAELTEEELQQFGDKWTLAITFAALPNQPFEFHFSVDDNWFNPLKYELNKTIEVEGQKLIVHDVTVHPTTTLVNISRHPDNDELILGLERFALRNGDYNLWSSLAYVHFPIAEDGAVTVELSNNFRTVPKDLNLSFSKVLAVDEGKKEVVLDISSEEIIQGPDGLKVKSIEKKNEHLVIELMLNEVSKSPEFFGSVYTTENGREGGVFYQGSTYWYDPEETTFTAEFLNVDNATQVQFPVYFTDKQYDDLVRVPVAQNIDQDTYVR